MLIIVVIINHAYFPIIYKKLSLSYSYLVSFINIIILSILIFLLYSTQLCPINFRKLITFFSFQLFFIYSLQSSYFEAQFFSHIMLCHQGSFGQRHKLAMLSYAHKEALLTILMHADMDQISFM